MVIDIAIFVFVVTVVVGALSVAFGGWVVVSMLRGTSRLFTGNSFATRQMESAVDRPCPRRGCGGRNPAEARFCRRCGMSLTAARQPAAKRAACW